MSFRANVSRWQATKCRRGNVDTRPGPYRGMQFQEQNPEAGTRRRAVLASSRGERSRAPRTPRLPPRPDTPTDNALSPATSKKSPCYKDKSTTTKTERDTL